MPPTDSATSRVWLDEGEVDATWSPPDAQPPEQAVRPVLTYGGIGLALVLVVALVWGLGGFDRRTDALLDTPVGTTVTTGPYQLRFTEATAQQRTDNQGEVSWRVSVRGEGLTTGTTTIAPDYLGDDGMFAAKDRATGEVQTPEGQTFRPGGATFGGAFTPGLPMQPLAIQFDFTKDYRPGTDLTFVVFQLELSDTSLLGNQDERWNNTDTAYRFQVPVTELPPATS